MLERILSEFLLEGEVVVRKATGLPVQPAYQPTGYAYVALSRTTVTRALVRFHRLKFALAHGWLPEMVDHANGDRLDNSLTNLRAATRQQNAWNTPGRRKASSLPRGVVKNGRGFLAQARVNGRTHYLGTHSTPEEASAAAEAFRRDNQGGFYCPPSASA